MGTKEVHFNSNIWSNWLVHHMAASYQWRSRSRACSFTRNKQNMTVQSRVLCNWIIPWEEFPLPSGMRLSPPAPTRSRDSPFRYIGDSYWLSGVTVLSRPPSDLYSWQFFSENQLVSYKVKDGFINLPLFFNLCEYVVHYARSEI